MKGSRFDMVQFLFLFCLVWDMYVVVNVKLAGVCVVKISGFLGERWIAQTCT